MAPRRPSRPDAATSAEPLRRAELLGHRVHRAGPVRRTIYDDEVGTIVWTSDFEKKHFAYTDQEAIEKGKSRLKTSAYKSSGARPSRNTLIIYDLDLLFYLKEQVLKRGLRETYLVFKFSHGYDVNHFGVKMIAGSATVWVNGDGMIDHLESIEAETLEERSWTDLL